MGEQRVRGSVAGGDPPDFTPGPPAPPSAAWGAESWPVGPNTPDATGPALETLAEPIAPKAGVSRDGSTVIVQRGESLLGVAGRVGVTAQVLFDHNRGVIGANPRLVPPGTRLVIPE